MVQERPIALICDDMIFSSKITTAVKGLGLLATVRPNITALLPTLGPGVRLVLLDLSNPTTTTAEEIGALRAALPAGARLIAYGSHVDVERLQMAHQAGCDHVLTRSQFVAQLVDLLESCRG